MWGIPNAGTWQKIGRNERLGIPSTKWLSLTPERFPHHTRPTFTRSTLLRGQVPHTARNKLSAVACHFLPAILALFGENFTRKCTDFWGYRVDCLGSPYQQIVFLATVQVVLSLVPSLLTRRVPLSIAAAQKRAAAIESGTRRVRRLGTRLKSLSAMLFI